MTRPRLARFSFGLAVLLVAVQAQYQQDYTQIISQQGSTDYFYQPTINDVPKQVVDLSESKYVVLTYNCYYMRDICKNVYNFQKTSRGQQLHPRSGLDNTVFGYDLQTNVHTTQRRKHSCPRTWKNSHPCPETDQRLPMRDDGEWYTTSVEPGTSLKLMDRYDIFGNWVESSKIQYSCDEFPPASWVEGGDGENADQPAQTRCAALPCAANTKAEQNWQGTAHRVLRGILSDLAAEAKKADPVKFAFYSADDSIILFNHQVYNQADGTAAVIRTYNETAIGTVLDKTSTVKQGFRRRNGGMTAPIRNPRQLTYEELRELAKIDGVLEAEYFVHVNHTLGGGDTQATSDAQLLGRSLPLGTAAGGSMAPVLTSVDAEDAEDDGRSLWTNGTFASTSNSDPPQTRQTRQPREPRAIPESAVAPLAKRANATSLAQAQAIVAAAVDESARRNGLRMARPLRNIYGLRPGSGPAGRRRATDNTDNTAIDNENAAVVPLLNITDAIADAAALVAEAEAHGNATMRNATLKRAVAATGTYWMQGLARKGTVPWGNDASYVVFRNVLDYGAVGDGVTDDTKAIKNAMTSGKRCGEKCNGSTTKNAIVYFPPGKYLISSTVPMPFGTQVIGDANNRPTLIAAGSFVGLGVLSTDEYTGGDGGSEQYYVNTANFYRQIRNIAIDITAASANTSCLHYQVAQATSLQNVELIASTDAAKNQIGMFAENGSGGHISDVTFTGGSVGLYGGSQQFTAQRLTFSGCAVGVHVIWDWGWVWKGITMSGVGVGFRLVAIDGSGNVGSVSILDSSFSSVSNAAVVMAPPSTSSSSSSKNTGLVLENVKLTGVAAAVKDTAGTVHLDGASAVVNSWVLGTTYEGSATARGMASGGPVGDHRRDSNLLDSTGAYFERAKPQYEDHAVGDFMHVKDFGATGDGVTDDTAAFQSAIYGSIGKILFVDAGSYILTSTMTIPAGAKIVGETWSQLVASGSYFADAKNPKVFLQVGTSGSVGSVEMQDLLFTSRGPTPGLILVEWNMQAESPGAAGIWDCHARLGGATGTQLTPAECPAVTSGTDAGCSAASLMMHLTADASGYFENMWLWGADHMIDDPDLSSSSNDMTQCSIYIARGFLIESTHPTWLYGTASEHSVFYQFNFHQAAHIFAGFLQTESAYFQPTPPPPAPFAAVVGDFPGDPDYTCAAGDDFSGCDESWAVIMTGCRDLYVASAGVYTWFSTYSQACIDSQACQKTLVRLDGNLANVRIQNLVTIGAKYMAVMDGAGIDAAPNLNVDVHPFWSLVANIDVGSNGTTDFNEVVWIDPAIWDMDQPTFTCIAPCHVKLPPYPGATSTVDYPLLTVSSGAWTSTITAAPLTISEWFLETVTLTTGDGKAKRAAQGFAPFVPVAATTPFWPSVSYMGPDGQTTYTAPTQTFPAPPVGVVQRTVVPLAGIQNYPSIDECYFWDPSCLVIPWTWDGDGGYTDSDDGDDNAAEFYTACPVSRRMTITIKTTSASSTSSSSSTSLSTSSSTTKALPVPSPKVVGDPAQNKVHCYKHGEKTENERMANAAKDFCNLIKNDKFGSNYYKEQSYAFDYNGGFGSVSIVNSFRINKGCTWTWDLDECLHYFRVPTDSCDCGGINGKHGGEVTNNCYEFRIDPNLDL